MNEKETIEQLNSLRSGIYPYNWIVLPSELGLPWVRLQSYSCCGWQGEKYRTQDFDCVEMQIAFENNQGINSPEDFLGGLDKFVKVAGPAYWMIEGEDKKLVVCEPD